MLTSIDKNLVLSAAREFEKAWNEGNLRKACVLYSFDAIFVSRNSVVCQRENILAKYQAAYPNQMAMGKLSLDLIDFRCSPSADGKVATAIFWWTLEKSDGSNSKGISVENYEIQNGKLYLVLDASM